MIRQDAIEHADRLVTYSHQDALPGSFARGLVLTPLIIDFERWLMRDEPQGVMRAPISEVGTAYVRDLREFADTGAAFEAPDVEASQFASLFAMGVLADIAESGQDCRGRGLADARQLPQLLAVLTRRK
jgi:hypothetical protein